MKKIGILLYIFILFTLSSCSKQGNISIDPHVCGENLVDQEGNEYRTIDIDGKCWTIDSINVDKNKEGKEVKSLCYNEEGENCEDYGSLYSYGEAFRLSRDDNNVRDICPLGWHLPGEKEINSLANFLSEGSCEDEQECRLAKEKFSDKEGVIEYGGSCDMVCDYHECNNECSGKDCRAVYLFHMADSDKMIPGSRFIVDACGEETIIETRDGGIDSYMSVKCVLD
ncbi:hypothetical protein C0584_02535 [Candidatus Parcubacteria bacterium]|nr:MAG: hypothetical protein C0584_02535 [Candidatus Parcubacteria bacterium]